MRAPFLFALAPLALAACVTTAAAQEAAPAEGDAPGEAASAPAVWVHVAGGRKFQVEELTESADGIWYRRGNVTTFLDRARVVRIEREAPAGAAEAAPEAPAAPAWNLSDSRKVLDYFAKEFGRPLPVTAFGQSDLHRRWNFDHSNSMDVGLHPDSAEGRALVKYLREANIPFLTFRSAVPGVASGPHIHVGRPSPRLRAR